MEQFRRTLIASLLLILSAGASTALADERYYMNGILPYDTFGAALAKLRDGNAERQALAHESTSVSGGVVTWNYSVKPEPLKRETPYVTGSSVAPGPFPDEFSAAAAYAEWYKTNAQDVCSVGQPTPASGWSLPQIYSNPSRLIEHMSFRFEVIHGKECEHKGSAGTGVARVTLISCPEHVPSMDIVGNLCRSGARGTIVYAGTNNRFVAADEREAVDSKCDAVGGNPCNAVSGDKIEEAVDFLAPGGLDLRRTFTTASGRWTFAFEARVDPWSPPGHRDYDSVAAKSAPFASSAEACEHGWPQIAASVEPGFVGSAARMTETGCVVSLGGVAKYRLKVFSGRQDYQPPENAQRVVRRPDGSAIHFGAMMGGWVPVDSAVAMRLVETAGGFTLYLQGGDEERYNEAGRLVGYTREGRPYTVTWSDTQVTVADEFGRGYVATYVDGHVARVEFPDQSAVDYTYEGPRLTEVRFSNGENEQYAYETRGSFTVLTERRLNNRPFAAWSYDSAGRATSSQHADGAERVDFQYGDYSSRVTGALGEVRVLKTAEVGGTARLTSVTDEAEKVYERRSYDDHGFIETRTDALGHVTTYVHDIAGRESSRTEAFGTDLARTIATTWDPTHPYLPETVTTPTQVTAFTYTPTGRIRSETRTDRATGQTRTTTYTYDFTADGLLVTIDGPRTDLADLTRIQYDPAGNLTSVTNALNHVTRFADHDGAGRPHTVTDPNGRSGQLDYDGRGRLNYLKRGTEVTALTYTPAGDLWTVALPSGELYTYTWDDARRLRAVTDGAGNHMDYEPDALGNRKEEKLFAADGTPLRHHHRLFNTLGQLWQTFNNAGDRTGEYAYDDNGALWTATDGRNHTTLQTYDALNRLHEVTDARNGITTYTWRSDDLIESVTDPNRNTTTYTYNGFGDLLRQESPDTGVTTFTHDDAGNPVTRTDAKGQTTLYTYDALNRLTTATYADGTVTYTWDTAVDNGLGRLAAIRDFSGTTRYNYTPHGRVKAKRQTILGRTLATFYEYDAAGRLKTLTYPSGLIVTYRWSGEKVTRILANGYPLLTEITHEPFGGPVRWTFRNGQVVDRTLNLDGQLTAHTLGGETRQLGYDLAGNVTSFLDSESTGFGYDELNRLTSATSPAFTLGWDYDPNGNRQHQTSGTETTTYEYLPLTNRLRAIDGATYALVNHDLNGNRTGDGNHSYQYDPRDRLITVDDGATATYFYNALGQRVAKRTATDRRGFAYNETGQLLGDYDATGQAIQETLWLGDLPVVTIQAGAAYYIHPDHLGTPRVIADQNGRTVWRWDSEPFGSDAANEDPDGDGVALSYNLRFPGQYYDRETGGHYNYFRDYDPSTGRYTTSDPIGLRGGLNTYAYVGNAPTDFSDPFGLKLCKTQLPGLGDTFLDDVFNARVQKWLSLNAKDGISVNFTYGFRTTAEQAGMASDPSAITPAAPGTSWHEAGQAVDLHWNWLSSQQRSIVVANAMRAGIWWGGYFQDNVHFFSAYGNRANQIQQAQKDYADASACGCN